jgi:hypothetical protein
LLELVVRSIETPSCITKCSTACRRTAAAARATVPLPASGFAPWTTRSATTHRAAQSPSDPHAPGARFHGGHLVAQEFDGDTDAID